MKTTWTEEEIIAWVDGSLPPDKAAEIARIVETDAEARWVAEETKRSNALVQAAFASVLTAPVPEDLRNALETDRRRMSFVPRRMASQDWPRFAAAASLVLAVGIAALLAWGPENRRTVSPESALHTALETLPSGGSEDGVTPMLSFLDQRQRICREFETTAGQPDRIELGVACRGTGGEWQIQIIVEIQTRDRSSTGFQLAEGESADALQAKLDELGTESVLSPDEEAELLARGWRR